MYFELFFADYDDTNLTHLLEYCNYIPFFFTFCRIKLFQTLLTLQQMN